MQHYSTRKRRVTNIDVSIGENLRRLRNERGISQEALAAAIRLTFQQVQKYEKGLTRVSLSRAIEIARALGISVSDLTAGVEPGSPPAPLALKPVRRAVDDIPDPRHRSAVIRLARVLAEKAA
jgi:transcriptional regulator with XRE-family HTH domain